VKSLQTTDDGRQVMAIELKIGQSETRIAYGGHVC
jgi:hypothetical protein